MDWITHSLFISFGNPHLHYPYLRYECTQLSPLQNITAFQHINTWKSIDHGVDYGEEGIGELRSVKKISDRKRSEIPVNK